MITPAIIHSINSSVLCWLATASADGQPNVSPKEIFTHHGDQDILVANIMSPGTVKNIKDNPKVSISFLDVLVQKGFQIKGSAEIIDKQHGDFKELHQPLFEIAGPAFPILSVIKITVEYVKPIVAPRYVLFPETTEAEQIESAKNTYNLNGSD